MSKTETKTEGGSWKKKLQSKWGEHGHCIICGRAIPFEKQTCSQACQDKYKGAEKKKAGRTTSKSFSSS